MTLNYKNLVLLLFLFFYPNAKSAEQIFLYEGNFSRTIKVEDLNEFKETRKPSNTLKYLMKITKVKNKDLHDFLSYKIDLPIKTSNRLMNSKIGKVFLGRLSKIIYPNKLSKIKTNSRAIKAGLILSSYKNNERIDIIDFLEEYPNKNVAIDLGALNKTLKKAESLKELIDFYSNLPFQKLKDGRSSN